MSNQSNSLELMITTIAAASTPVLAYYFRGRRTRKPKNNSEKLYQYYENYIDRLEKQLAKKDTIIYAQERQNKDQQEVIAKLQTELSAQQLQLDKGAREINKLKKDLSEMQSGAADAHQNIAVLRKKALEEK